MNKYLGIIGYVGIETSDGRELPHFEPRDVPLPVYQLGGEYLETSALGTLTEVWADDFGRIWAWAELACSEKLITGGMDMLVSDDYENWELAAFTVYTGDSEGFASPAWHGIHLLRVDV